MQFAYVAFDVLHGTEVFDVLKVSLSPLLQNSSLPSANSPLSPCLLLDQSAGIVW